MSLSTFWFSPLSSLRSWASVGLGSALAADDTVAGMKITAAAVMTPMARCAGDAAATNGFLSLCRPG